VVETRKELGGEDSKTGQKPGGGRRGGTPEMKTITERGRRGGGTPLGGDNN